MDDTNPIKEKQEFVDAIKTVLNEAIAAGGSTLLASAPMSSVARFENASAPRRFHHANGSSANMTSS